MKSVMRIPNFVHLSRGMKAIYCKARGMGRNSISINYSLKLRTFGLFIYISCSSPIYFLSSCRGSSLRILLLLLHLNSPSSCRSPSLRTLNVTFKRLQVVDHQSLQEGPCKTSRARTGWKQEQEKANIQDNSILGELFPSRIRKYYPKLLSTYFITRWRGECRLFLLLYYSTGCESCFSSLSFLFLLHPIPSTSFGPILLIFCLFLLLVPSCIIRCNCLCCDIESMLISGV